MTYYPDDHDFVVGLKADPSFWFTEDNFWEIGAGPSGARYRNFSLTVEYGSWTSWLRLQKILKMISYIEILEHVLFNSMQIHLSHGGHKEPPKYWYRCRFRSVCGGYPRGKNKFLNRPFATIREVENYPVRINPDEIIWASRSLQTISVLCHLLLGWCSSGKWRTWLCFYAACSAELLMHGQKLGINELSLTKVPTVGKIMESYYPEVLEKQDFIEKLSKWRRIICSYTLFRSTLQPKYCKGTKNKGQSVISGTDV